MHFSVNFHFWKGLTKNSTKNNRTNTKRAPNQDAFIVGHVKSCHTAGNHAVSFETVRQYVWPTLRMDSDMFVMWKQ